MTSRILMPMIADVIADQQRVHAAINNADIAHLRSWLGQIEDILANGFDDDGDRIKPVGTISFYCSTFDTVSLIADLQPYYHHIVARLSGLGIHMLGYPDVVTDEAGRW